MVVGMVNLVIVAKAIESRPLFVCECFLCVLRHTHTQFLWVVSGCRFVSPISTSSTSILVHLR
jgi:hypothetical protein